MAKIKHNQHSELCQSYLCGNHVGGETMSSSMVVVNFHPKLPIAVLRGKMCW